MILSQMNYLPQFLITFLLSTFLTGWVRQFALKRGIVSVPRNRDVHKKPVPRIGGIAIFLSFMIVSLILLLKGADKHVISIWLGATVIAFSMLFDDLKNLPAWKKFIIQFSAVAILIAGGVGINTLTNPFGGANIDLNSVYIPIMKLGGVVYHFSLWSDLLTLFWLVGMMNIINFVDGVDGLAGGVSFIAASIIFFLCLSLGVSQAQTAELALILAGAVGGFLVWNFPPAKIFMGDCGAMFLGFVLGALTLVSGGKLATVFLVLGFPIVDSIIVAGGRVLRHQNPFTTPDKTHLHHRFLKAGYSARQAIISIYLISIAFGWTALRGSTRSKLFSAVILVVILFLITRFLNKKAQDRT